MLLFKLLRPCTRIHPLSVFKTHLGKTRERHPAMHAESERNIIFNIANLRLTWTFRLLVKCKQFEAGKQFNLVGKAQVCMTEYLKMAKLAVLISRLHDTFPLKLRLPVLPTHCCYYKLLREYHYSNAKSCYLQRCGQITQGNSLASVWKQETLFVSRHVFY